MNSMKDQVIDLKVFQDQSLEIHTKIEAKQQRVISQVEIVIAQFVARSNDYKIEGQTCITGTYPTQCHHDGKVLSL